MNSTALGAEKENINFISEAHEKFYYEKIQKVREADVYHKALCYCIGMNEDTRRNVDRIYNFKTGCVKPECLHEGWQTSGSAKVVRMAFNLYCNGTPSVDDEQDTEEQVDECRRYSVEDLFCCCYAPYFWQAIQIRYPEYATYNKNLYASLGYVEPDELGVTLATIMTKVINEDEISEKDGILHHQENVDLLPANIELSTLEVTMGNVMSREMIMKEYIDTIRFRYDYILIDCLPNLSDTEMNYNKSNQIVSADENRSDGDNSTEEYQAFENLVKETVDYESLEVTHHDDMRQVDEIVNLIVETVMCKNDKILIASNWYPASLVKKKFLMLTYSHIEYVLHCMRGNTSKVKNIKKYLLAALFNAPSTMNGYYQAEVNHDMPGLVR